ncbi:hypothetical protein GTP81_12580 [Rugamonas sp. FT107W]|uniref:Uncharacterized protein n=1 Tax=Duganella vulcania TaxID=2692166 RepID=A0A845HFL3_9BURK|nr:FAD-dependent oxidoreductase [Duganella vulcania]MYN17590.1 hypothetical protein [Duganella vulcania]
MTKKKIAVPKVFEEIDSLSLIAHKVASNVFDLSSGQINVSIRDQMVRAQHLVSDLRRADPTAKSLLIVGMGVAGMNAALAACEAGFSSVCVVESKPRPFSMFRGVTSRFVGPYMYEWPSPFHERQSYPSHYSTPWAEHGVSPLAWEASEPISAADLAIRLDRGLHAWWDAAKSKPYLVVGISKRAVRNFVIQFARTEKLRSEQRAAGSPMDPRQQFHHASLGARAKLWPEVKQAAPPPFFEPDYVILAAGMGKEVLDIPDGPVPATPRFWSDDGLKAPAVPMQRVVVLGGGDGAIQDALRALTIHHHPASFIDQLEAMPVVRQALDNEKAALLSADRQLRQHSSWSLKPSGYAMADLACRQAARNLASNAAVKEQVLKALRKGTGEVILYVREATLGKAYMLNRFAIYLLAACVSRDCDKNDGGMGFMLQFDTEVKRGLPPGAARTKFALEVGAPNARKSSFKIVEEVDHTVVRFGIDADTIPGPQLIQLNVDDRMYRERTTLKRVELPFVAMK